MKPTILALLSAAALFSTHFLGAQAPTAPDDPGGRNLLPAQVKGIVGATTLSIGAGHVAALLDLR